MTHQFIWNWSEKKKSNKNPSTIEENPTEWAAGSYDFLFGIRIGELLSLLSFTYSLVCIYSFFKSCCCKSGKSAGLVTFNDRSLRTNKVTNNSQRRLFVTMKRRRTNETSFDRTETRKRKGKKKPTTTTKKRKKRNNKIEKNNSKRQQQKNASDR